jgi:hypothetical protein
MEYASSIDPFLRAMSGLLKAGIIRGRPHGARAEKAVPFPSPAFEYLSRLGRETIPTAFREAIWETSL